MLPFVTVERVTKRFGATVAVDALSLAITAGEFFCLLGPSGCGKSTLLRMLAGFETPDEGRLSLDGEDITAVPPHRRPVNMMFQSYALFPHMTVAKNIAFGLQMEGLAREAIASRVEEMMRLVKLDGLGARKPDQLSGGQRQRVALARALAKRPKVLLLDEPLGALDRKLREETQGELLALQRKLGLTFIVVTHDQDEAMSMASRIGVMDKGRLVQVAAPRVLYERPANSFVARFVGDVAMLPAEIEQRRAGSTRVTTAFGAVDVAHDAPIEEGGAVTLAWRPEKARRLIGQETAQEGCLVVTATVAETGYRGDWTMSTLDAGSARIRFAEANTTPWTEQGLAVGDTVRIAVPHEALFILA